MLRVVKIAITTDGSGDSTDTSGDSLLGVLKMIYINDGDLADNWDMTFSYTNELAESVTFLTLTNEDADMVLYPRSKFNDNTGAEVNDYLDQIIDGKVTIVTADGGDTKSGAVLLYIDELRAG